VDLCAGNKKASAARNCGTLENIGGVMPLSQESPEARSSHIGYINTRWKQLHEMTSDASKDAATYLMVTNSGGAIAVLSFMGAMKSINPFPGAIWILGSFVLGVVLLGIARAVNYYRGYWLFSGWKRDVSKYYADNAEWSALLAEDEKRSDYFVWIDVIAWLSFLCFLTGLLIGFISIMCMKG
jgi:hypothetical protein